MNFFKHFAGGGAVLTLTALLGVAPAQDQPDPNAIPEGVEIQTRGPVHEAFAQPFDMKPEPGQIVPKAPPAPVPEEPPPERPDGANVQFIPGYWAWEPDEQRFLWVSGGYRNVPAGRQWVPGHWVQADGGWRWVPGWWAPEQQQEMRYTPEPPAPLEVEPSLPAPSDDATWIAGTWVYRDTRFVWRPGYWSPFRLGRVWSPAHYVWTPYGYVFADGYWDYPWEDRGLLFAPVYFNRPLWLTRGWFWRPSHVVSFGLFYDSCFTHRGSFHLYFGNYYGPRYAGFGFSPWFAGYGRYDSRFGYYRWRNGYDHNWYGNQRRLYDDRFAGRASVPPRTFAQQRNNLGAGVQANHVNVVAPLNQAKNVNKNVNLVRLSGAQLETQKQIAQRTQQIAQTRNLPAAKVGGVSANSLGAKTAPTLKLPPLVQGTQTIRSGVESGAKQLNPGKGPGLNTQNKNPAIGGASKDNKPSFDAGAKTFSKPLPGRPPTSNTAPQNTTPKVIKDFGPGKGSSNPAAKSFQSPDAKPRSFEFKPSGPPKTSAPSVNPRTYNFTNPAPRKLETPRFNAPPTPRSGGAPRYSVPQKSQSYRAPFGNSPAPRMSSPASSGPRFSSPSSSRRPAPSGAPRGGGGKGPRGRD